MLCLSMFTAIRKKDILESFKLIKEDKDFVFPLLPYPEPIDKHFQ